ncbi:serine/threonine-protein kinase [Grosmannia clavigera kw1407]|uniref:Serine/threonine-protein kinase n=1 Tax=Grosmannia clavigera (strain kw1407 / UAMH 11150) TaxID=655863 RepID=F0XHD4_GROCL|nr:serine/threonine-protein kinase [Grosmannia clavigera kw1407]EFX03036.1 serine/threonine-protein kinase [Grosmannia clavigera kw1407]
MAGKGIDVEALSPRDANARRPRATTMELKPKTVAQLKANKDKEHPAPPPPNVTEPPSADRRDGAVYQVGKLLGKGGFAVCYSGVLAGTKKVYALKIVKSKMPAKMGKKFQTELQIHSKMRHVNIVQFFRAFSFESSTYLVLELCPNGSLMDMVKRRKGVTEAEVRFYAVQIAGAIKYMHAKGIIHRDLKMGNIFLDRHMNAKIGDFGLAALLVTGRDMQTIRRTTLCGTPNYIAPEILEKGRQGHDHMVDIWSLGIIMYAMLTSKPPFQSSTTDEIYRRAKERDYEWPAAEVRPISSDAKHVVASMLQEAHMRPDPDAIIEHPFFTTGYLPTPADMTMRLRDLPPERDCFYRIPSSPRVQAQNLDTLKAMCVECGVGPWAKTKLLSKPVWREMAAEEQAGLTPAIPLADDVVYRPFETWLQETQLLRAGSGGSSRSTSASVTRVAAGPSLAVSASAASSASTPVEAQPPVAEWLPPAASLSGTSSRKPAPSADDAATSTGLRAPPQSFAAQQRQQGRVSARRDVAVAKGLSLQAREQAAASAKSSATSATNATNATIPTTTTTTLTTRSHRTVLPGSKSSSSSIPSSSSSSSAVPERKTALRPASSRSTQQQQEQPKPQQPQQQPQPQPQPQSLSQPQTQSRPEAEADDDDVTAIERPPRLSLFSPYERQELVPGSEPDVVLARLHKLQAELDRALNARTMAFVSARDKTAGPPQIVVKWVDYTNKFGLGYILNDGSVGCILRAIHVPGEASELPPSCLMVRGAERHIQRREDVSYPDRQQIVPMGRRRSGDVVEGEGEGAIRFYENNGERGLRRVCVDASRFRVAVDSRSGAAGKLSAGRDAFDHRKRERIVLWKKFANYMLAYGRELEGNQATADARNPSSSSSSSSSSTSSSSASSALSSQPLSASDDAVVTFYQRFGDVGCWVFGDGHLQFNFPDHTKMVLDAAGVSCHFWHLPAAAAERLAATGLVDEEALDSRSVLSYPLQTLLNFSSVPSSASAASRRRPNIRPELQNIPAANDFRRKVEFVRSIVREWVSRRGLGNSDMSHAGRLRWMGARETAKLAPGTVTPTPVPASKHVWVTIGARLGDVRVSAMVDPRRPGELGPDLDEVRR